MPDYNPVGWFELPAIDLDRAQKFYETVFGFNMRKGENAGYQMVWFPGDGNLRGTPGILIAGEGYKPVLGGAIIYFTAPNMDEILGRVEGAGGKIMLPKKQIGEYGFIAWINDTEGNIVGLHKRLETM